MSGKCGPADYCTGFEALSKFPCMQMLIYHCVVRGRTPSRKFEQKSRNNHAKSCEISQNHTKSLKCSPPKKIFIFVQTFGLTGLFLSPPHRKKTWLRKRNAYELCMICPSPALPSVFSGSASSGKGKVFYLICSGLVEDQVLVRSHLVHFPVCIQKFVGPLVFHKGQKYP